MIPKVLLLDRKISQIIQGSKNKEKFHYFPKNIALNSSLLFLSVLLEAPLVWLVAAVGRASLTALGIRLPLLRGGRAAAGSLGRPPRLGVSIKEVCIFSGGRLMATEIVLPSSSRLSVFRMASDADVSSSKST